MRNRTRRTKTRNSIGRDAGPSIACINRARTPLGIDFHKLIGALQAFVDECLAPVWGTSATLVPARKERRGAWTLVFLDDADRAHTLGYHKSLKHGLPLAKVFVRPSLKRREAISLVASHELAEMLVDPSNSIWCLGPKRKLYAYEVCDAVEQVQFKLGGIAMSDFLYPSYFQTIRQARSTQFDYLGKITRPFQVLRGGFALVRARGKKTVEFGSAAKARDFRTEDRRYHRSQYR
jgi:hypothetical protein